MNKSYVSKNIAVWSFTVLSLLFALLVCFGNIDAAKKNGEYFWQSHQEGVSLTRTKDDLKYGLAPVDVFSKEFPIVYNFLGDYVLGYISDVAGKPPYVIQSFLYPKLLATFFLLLNFISIYLITKNKLASLLTTLLLMFTSDIIYFDALYKVIDPDIVGFKSRMHLPSITMSLGVDQSVGWLMFFPVIASAYLARKHSWLGLYILSGIGLGLLFQIHTLTFINVMTIVAVWFLIDRSPEQASILGLRLIVFLLLFIGWTLFSGRFGVVQFVVLWCCAFAISIRERKDILRLLVMGLTAAAVSYQFIRSLINSYEIKGGLDILVDSRIDYKLVLSYYLIYWCLFAIVLFRRKSEAEKLGVVIVGCTLALGFGQLFGFYNHQYRFIINLCFGLFLLAPLAILKLNEFKFWYIPLEGFGKKGAFNRVEQFRILLVSMVAIVLVGLWSVSAYRDVMIITGHGEKVTKLGYNTKYYNVDYAIAGEAAFLSAVSKIPDGARVLLPPEDEYPRRVFHNAIILGTGKLSAFIPDYRYIVDKKSYRDRVYVYCSIFPNYSHWDMHYNDRFCEDFKTLDRLKSDGVGALDVLGIYGINYIIQWPESNDKKLDSLYDSNEIYGNDDFRIWETGCENVLKGGRVCFERAVVRGTNFEFSAKAPRTGKYNLCFSGAHLVGNTAGIAIGGNALHYTAYGSDSLRMTVDFSADVAQKINFKFKDDKRNSPVMPSPFYSAKGLLMTAKNQSGCS